MEARVSVCSEGRAGTGLEVRFNFYRESYTMKTSVVRFALVLALVGGPSVAWWMGQRVGASQAGVARRIRHYVDPMNPSHTSKEPGLAPCGMKMEPVYEDEEVEAGKGVGDDTTGLVRVGASKRGLVGVEVEPVVQGLFTNTVRLFGRVMADERRVHRLNAGVDGQVREVSAVGVGSLVKKDTWLASFSAPEARASIQGFLTATAVLDRQKKLGVEDSTPLGLLNENARLAADRLQNFGISPGQIEEIRTSREVPSLLRIHSPVEGVVLRSEVAPSLKFEKGGEWYRVANLDRVWIWVDAVSVTSETLKTVREVRVHGAGFAGHLMGEMAEVLPQYDPVTRTMKARVDVENRDLQLRPDMAVEVEMTFAAVDRLSVSSEAIVDTGAGRWVYVEREAGEFEPRAVETGNRSNGRVELLSGVEAGEKVVVEGNFLIDSESRMRMASRALSAEELKDPVCGMKVEKAVCESEGLVVHDAGQSHYFCNVRCLETYQRSPKPFMAKKTKAGH